jgi:hypothetical protein
MTTPMHITSQKVLFPLRCCVAIRHPGQVRLRRMRAGIQTTSPRRRGTRHQMTLLTFHWIPDLARLAWMFHELLSRDREDGRATWQPRYAAGADTRGRKGGRPYPWSQQVIHEISRLGMRSSSGMTGSANCDIVSKGRRDAAELS